MGNLRHPLSLFARRSGQQTEAENRSWLDLDSALREEGVPTVVAAPRGIELRKLVGGGPQVSAVMWDFLREDCSCTGKCMGRFFRICTKGAS